MHKFIKPKCLFTFSKTKQITIKNIFIKNSIQKYHSLSPTDILNILKEIKTDKNNWRTADNQVKNTIIKNFYDKLKQVENVQRISRLLSQCTGKQLVECLNQMRVALKIFYYDNSYQYLSKKQYDNNLEEFQFKDYYTFQPFDAVLNIFDHRNPILSTFKYLGLALKSNNFLLLRPSFHVIPVVKAIQNIWNQNSKFPLIKTLIDPYLDPKAQESPVSVILKQTDSFISFSGRIKEGFDFHSYVSQQSQTFRQDEYLLKSSDSAYIMKDLSKQQISKSIKIIARGCFSNCGHNFNSIKRVFIDREISEVFIAQFLQESKRYTVSKDDISFAKEADNNCGLLAPFLLQTQFNESLMKLADLKQKYQDQFTLLQGGEIKSIKIWSGTLNFITPTIFITKNEFPNYNYQNEEYMFPVCFISIVDSPSSCIQKINSSIYGISSSIFTSNTSLQAIEAIGSKLDVGTVNVNTWQVTDGITYSGRKRSGKGISLSPLSFNNIVMTKSVSYS